MIEASTLLVSYFHKSAQVCTIWLVLQHFLSTDLTSSGLVWFNGIIKTQLARFVEALQLPWLKELPFGPSESQIHSVWNT